MHKQKTQPTNNNKTPQAFQGESTNIMIFREMYLLWMQILLFIKSATVQMHRNELYISASRLKHTQD